MDALLIAALISIIGVIAAALIAGIFGLLRRNGLNPKDPDKTPIAQCSVGWFMREMEKSVARGVAEGLRRAREPRR